MTAIFQHLFGYFSRHKGLFAFCCVVLVGISGFMLTRTHFEEDISKIMPSDAQLQQMNDLLDHSDFADRIVLSISQDVTGSPEPLIAFCDSFLNALPAFVDTLDIRQITAKIDDAQFQEIYRFLSDHLPLFLEPDDYAVLAARAHPDSIGRYLQGAFRLLMTPGGSFVKPYILRDPLSFTPVALEHLQRYKLDENFSLYNGYVVTDDFRHLVVFITPEISARETQHNARLLAGLDDLLAVMHDKYPEVRAEYFGAAMVAVDNASQVRRDVTLTVSIAVVILFLLILYFFRRPRVFLFLILPTVLGAMSALAILGQLRDSVSIIAIGIGSVLVGITIDYALHIFTHLRDTGDRRLALRELVWPILVSSLTTAAAFACLFVVRSQGLHDLGAFAVLSVLITAVLALIMLPLLPVKLHQASHGRRTFLEQWAEYPLHRNRFVLWALGGISVICVFGARKVAFEDDLYKINYMSARTAAAERNLNALTTETHRGLYLAAGAPTIHDALEKERAILPLLDSLKSSGVISQYAAVSSLIPSLEEQEERISRWQRFWSPERIASTRVALTASAASLGFKAGTFDPFIQRLEADHAVLPESDFIDIANAILPGYLSRDSAGTTLLSLVRVNLDRMDSIYPYFADQEEVRILDKGYLISRFVDILRKDFQGLVLLSFLLVFFILHMALGRIELTLITFLPVTLSWIWTLGLMHYLDLKFNIINIIITSFIFGLGIDYAIFIIRGLQSEYQYGIKRLKTYKTSVLLSVITTLTGIGVMIIAKHPALRSISAISIIGILSVVIFAFAIQPRMFEWLFFKADGTRREYPLTLANTLKTLIIYGTLAVGTVVVTILALLGRLLLFAAPEVSKTLTHWMIWQFSRFYIWISFFPHYRLLNPHHENFRKPAIIIANHNSHIDTTILFSLTMKLVILTKDWVYQFPLYYLICRLADFYTVSEGVDRISGKLRERLARGYHIAIFPEGSRSETDKPRRFHKGAFLLADDFELDILPVHIHGTGRYLRKGSFWGQSNDVTVEIGRRISYAERMATGLDTKAISRQFKAHHAQLTEHVETCYYFRRALIENYIYKGPVLEWYLRVKLRLEDYYRPFDEMIPGDAQIVDLGCGYGFMDYMLAFRSPHRRILGIDYDEQKIKTATHCHARTERITFRCADVTAVDFDAADIILLSDVLHYLTPERQAALLERCLERLKAHGKLIIRDGDRDMTRRHRGTKLTEWFSTHSGFNKTKNPLHYLSGKALMTWAHAHGLHVEVIDLTRLSSNLIYCISR